ncbi:acyl carrier protein [Anaerosalibacter sp. Marseille-P3206]|uniref:acyl carrier protein n=1 Tax=Anaerosalibacter sp. Marseille-P3206 TaxID=1871005 RepID=UPI0009876983|nr:acyl carrier protein [Anaerosalibacter sp. Marseille-P3206]
MVLERLKKIISEQLDVNEDDIKKDSSFQDDFNADSLDIVELIMALEDEFELEIEDDEIEKLKTVGDAVEYIQNHIDDVE